jgi:dipeptidyl aminopeptidase/acylaminoacyl peptidase
MDTGQTALLANLQKSPADLTWSPDGRWLAFVMSVTAKSEPIAKPREKPEGAEWSEPVKVIDTAQYRWDGRGFLETAYEHIFVIPADGGSPRQVTNGDFNHAGPLSWTPDGTGILFSANRDDGWQLESGESDIYRVSVGDGTLTRLTDKEGGELAPTMSPDGRRVAYVYDDNRKIPYRNSILHVMAPDGSGDQALTADLDSSVSGVQWAGTRQIFFRYDQRAVRHVARVSVSGDFANVAAGLGSTSLGRPYLSGSFTVSSNGIVAYTKGTSQRPAEVAVAGRGRERVLTALNDDLLDDRMLGAVNEVIYNSSFDGQEIQGWYITPPDFDPQTEYPLILEIHGGPHLAYGPYFSAEMQLMVAQGYVVFYNNYRGSTSYGEDFALLLHYKYSSPEDFADHMSGVDTLIEKNIADPDNLFITGGSAGGIASAYAIGLTDRFRAAAVAKPVINWISKTLTADSYIGQISHQFPGMPWEEFEHYWQRSPLSLVGNMVTPTMLITGEEDYRTPISETEQLYQALQLKGVDVVMVRVPGSSHGIAGRPSRLVAKVDNILAWFARYRMQAHENQ